MTAGREAPDVVLALNSGSSSLKFAVIRVGGQAAEHRHEDEATLAEGAIEGIGAGSAGHAWIQVAGAKERTKVSASAKTAAEALEKAFAMLSEHHAGADVTMVGHRIVHGGPDHVKPALVDDALLASLRKVIPLAPLHMPAAIAALEAARARFPSLPHVVCFDTAFHATMPEVARRLPIPDRFYDAGVRRYGFHGLSYEYVMSVLGASPPARTVIAHLGSGASLVAVREGRSIDTTMGLTPTGGVVMGTRPGDLDPGVLIHLSREHGLGTDALEALMEHESGMKGLGGSSDMATLLERAPHDERARLAVAIFATSVRKAIGALAAALGGLDLLVFTGGIGEHAAEVRAEACRGLESFGIALDPARNQPREDAVLSTDASRCVIRRIATNEAMVIARHARRLRLATT